MLSFLVFVFLSSSFFFFFFFFCHLFLFLFLSPKSWKRSSAACMHCQGKESKGSKGHKDLYKNGQGCECEESVALCGATAV